jgi:hypothetical protein
LDLTEQELLDDTTVECHHVGTPHEPLNSLQEALAAGHSKDLRRHVDPALHEVILDNFHRPPHLRAQSRIVFLRKYTQQAQHFLLELNALRFGAIGSVAGFFRIPFAVWWIGVFGLGIACTAYFDDSSTLARP